MGAWSTDMTREEERAEAARIVAARRAEQGLPPIVEDPVALAQVADVMRPPRVVAPARRAS